MCLRYSVRYSTTIFYVNLQYRMSTYYILGYQESRWLGALIELRCTDNNLPVVAQLRILWLGRRPLLSGAQVGDAQHKPDCQSEVTWHALTRNRRLVTLTPLAVMIITCCHWQRAVVCTGAAIAPRQRSCLPETRRGWR